MKVYTNHRYIIKFPHTEKMHPLIFIDACWMFIETNQWVICFSSGGNNVCDELCFKVVNSQNEKHLENAQSIVIGSVL